MSKFSLEYNFWQSEKYKFDEGRYSDSNDSYYAEFNENYHNIGFLFSRLKYNKSRSFGYFYEGGIHPRFVKRKHLLESPYSPESERKIILASRFFSWP